MQSRSGRAERGRAEARPIGWVADLPEYPNAPLNDEIITRRSAREVLAIFGERGAELNHVNAITALHRIAKAGDGAAVAGDARFERLVARVVEHISQVPSARSAEARHEAAARSFKSWPPPAKDHQNLSNTAWALAKLSYAHAPQLEAIAAAAIPLIGEFNAQDLANTPWAFAKLASLNSPLCHAIASKAIARLAELNPQNLTNIAWSLAARPVRHGPLLESISCVYTDPRSACPPSKSCQPSLGFRLLGRC